MSSSSSRLAALDASPGSHSCIAPQRVVPLALAMNSSTVLLTIRDVETGPFEIRAGSTDGGLSARIEFVFPYSSADNAGVRQGDIPVYMNQNALMPFDVFTQPFSQDDAGPVTFRVLRQCHPILTTVKTPPAPISASTNATTGEVSIVSGGGTTTSRNIVTITKSSHAKTSATKSNGVDGAEDKSKKETQHATKAKISHGIVHPTDLDVIGGRGGGTNHHEGNKKFKKMARRMRAEYLRLDPSEKIFLAKELVRKVESSGGRFLEKADDGLWYQMDGVKARKKASGDKVVIN